MRTGAVFILLLILPASGWAHGGGHDKPDPVPAQNEMPDISPPMPGPEPGLEYGVGAEETGFNDGSNMYGMEIESTEHSMESMQHNPEPSLSGSDLLDDATPGFLTATSSTGEHAGHNMDTMPHVELSKHELVSTGSRGYGAAIGLTVFSGLLFGFLCIKRPFE